MTWDDFFSKHHYLPSDDKHLLPVRSYSINEVLNQCLSNEQLFRRVCQSFNGNIKRGALKNILVNDIFIKCVQLHKVYRKP